MVGAKPAEPLTSTSNTIQANFKVDVSVKQRTRTIQVSKTWTLDDFKSEILKVFGLQKNRVEIDSIVVLPKQKRKKILDDCEEDCNEGDS